LEGCRTRRERSKTPHLSTHGCSISVSISALIIFETSQQHSTLSSSNARRLVDLLSRLSLGCIASSCSCRTHLCCPGAASPRLQAYSLRKIEAASSVGHQCHSAGKSKLCCRFRTLHPDFLRRANLEPASNPTEQRPRLRYHHIKLKRSASGADRRARHH
jgi:hypothetical protein